MSSFQFPANPSDGDIVVRGNLQAFYDADTNTWRVSEVPTAPGIPGPPGPPGPEGPPGKGATIAGVVDTFADLPAPNAHQFELWVTDDTNTLYWSDGIEWFDFGSPIQGEAGLGWTSVTQMDSGDEYTITFNSDTPELQFTTPNLKGKDGVDGKDGASAAAGLAMQFARIEFDNTNQPGPLKTFETFGATAVPLAPDTEPWAKSVSKTITMPADSDMALVWWQASSDFAIGKTAEIAAGQDRAYTEGQAVVFRCYLKHTLEVNGADIISGTAPSNQAARTVRHNWYGSFLSSGGAWGKGTLEDRFTNEAFLKLELIQFPRSTEENKTEVQFDHFIEILDMSTGNITAGDMAITVIPFDSSLPENGPFLLQAQAQAAQYGNRSLVEEFVQLTPQDVKNENAADLKNRIGIAVGEIEDLIKNFQMQGDQAKVDDLLDIRSKLLSARLIPGDYAQIHTAISNQITRLNTNYLNNAFYFQTN